MGFIKNNNLNMAAKKLKYKRVLVKLSGEVFKADKDYGFDDKALNGFAKMLVDLQKMGAQVAVVNGGGNLWRFRDFEHLKLDRVISDSMGMMATVMNAMALRDAIAKLKAKVVAMSAYPCDRAMPNYEPMTARRALEDGNIVLLAGGTGSPFFTTDSAAALRALEIDADVLLKATKVDYVYDKDPVKFKDAKKYTKISYQEVIEKNLEVMDLTCASLCKSGDLPMIVFNVNKKSNLEKIIQGEKIGTIIN